MDQQISVAAPRGVARSFDPAVLIGEWVADMQERVDAGELSGNSVTNAPNGPEARRLSRVLDCIIPHFSV